MANPANIVLNISHNSDDTSVDEAVSAFVEANNGFTFPIADILFKAEEFEKVIREVKELHKDLEEFDYSKNKNNIYRKYTGENIRVYVSGNPKEVYASFYLRNEKDCHNIWKIYIANTKSENSVDLFSYSYSLSGGSLTENIKLHKKSEMDYISSSYYPYIDIDVMFEQFFTGDENILLLVGDPGIGKSKLSTSALKYAIDNPTKIPYDKLEVNPSLETQYISVAFVKSTEVLANDTFWRTLERNTPDFCIIDDLDYMLTKRDAEVISVDDSIRNSFLNQFLSFTDGVEKFKTKFIITTNQKYDDIDSALLRKGRLFDILELRHLKNDEALKIWKENDLDEKEFHNIFVCEDVLPAELGSEINKRLNKRIETATQPYLKESGISKIVKASRQKRVGL